MRTTEDARGQHEGTRPSASCRTGPAAHFAEATALESPFRLGQSQERDLVFAARAVGILGPAIRQWRDHQEAAIAAVAAALQPLSDHIEGVLHPVVARAARQRRPAHIAWSHCDALVGPRAGGPAAQAGG